MAEEQSSLRSAIDKIMGWPAGGSSGQGGLGGGTGGQGGAVDLAPAPRPADETISAISNVVPEAVADPFATQLAAIQAQNAALSAKLAPTAATAAAATRPAGLGEGKPWLTYEQQMRQDYAQSGVTDAYAEKRIADRLAEGGYTAQTMFDPAIHSPSAQAKEIAARPANFQTVTTTTGNPITAGINTSRGRPVAPAQQLYSVSRDQNMRPINPGSRAPWQASAQYWRDLDAYTKAGGK